MDNAVGPGLTPFSIRNYSVYSDKLEFAGVTNLSVSFADSSP